MVHKQAIDKVRKHVQEQAKAYKIIRPPEKEHEGIYRHCVVGMQRMKINAAPVWCKDRVCEQMVQVYQHSRYKDEVHPAPLLPEKQESDKQRQAKMEKVVRNALEHTEGKGTLIWQLR